MKYEMWQSAANKQWYWHLRAGGNHTIIAQGEGYKKKADCEHAITLVKGSFLAPVVETADLAGFFAAIGTPPKR